jgi:hypothetical protein
MKAILFVLALLGATVGRGQIVLDWYSQAPAGGGLLLDDYPNAAAAYSLRLLNSAYTGNCIEVRRSNDNALQSIGFAGGVVDTAALKTFCGANNCFVRTWYDQSGNGRNAVQTTTNSQQPRIVSGGVVDRENGNPAVVFTFASTTNLKASFTLAQPVTYIAVTRIQERTSIMFDGFSVTNSMSVANISDASVRLYSATAGISATIDPRQQMLITALANTTSSSLQVNATSVTGSIGSGSPAGVTIGSGATTLASGGTVQELVIYASDNSSNFLGIRTNVNTFYNVY